MSSDQKKLLGQVYGQHYKLVKFLGSGSFGEAYECEDSRNSQHYAIKLESAKTRAPQLKIEYKIYSLLGGGVGIPAVHYYGEEGEYNILVMELLELSLEDHLTHGPGTFSLRTVLMLADQMISLTQYIHSKNFIHRDIKPDNFIMGTGKNSGRVYIIDFGLSKRYRDSTTKKHIPYVENKSLTGTARYASINALKGTEQSRRDDLESLGYVLMYFLRGSLPWQGLPAKTTKQKYERILKVKMDTPVEKLCEGFPQEFVQYFKLVRSLEFEEQPNYIKLRGLFRDLFVKSCYVYDYKYDWTSSNQANVPTETLTVKISKPQQTKTPGFFVGNPPPVATGGGLPKQSLTQPATPKHSPRNEETVKQTHNQDISLPSLFPRQGIGYSSAKQSIRRKDSTSRPNRANKWSSATETSMVSKRPAQNITLHVSNLNIGMPFPVPRTQVPSPKRPKDRAQIGKRLTIYGYNRIDTQYM